MALGDATKLIEQGRRTDLGAPGHWVAGSFQGTAAAFQESLSSMPISILAAMLAVYIVLGVVYASYIHP